MLAATGAFVMQSILLHGILTVGCIIGMDLHKTEQVQTTHLQNRQRLPRAWSHNAIGACSTQGTEPYIAMDT